MKQLLIYANKKIFSKNEIPSKIFHEQLNIKNIFQNMTPVNFCFYLKNMEITIQMSLAKCPYKPLKIKSNTKENTKKQKRNRS